MDFQVIGLRKLDKKINNISTSMKRMTVINHKAVILLQRWIDVNFQKEGKLAMGGGGWKALSPVTILRRRKGAKTSKYADRILQDTGQLKGRWKHQYTTKVALIQSGVEYGIDHHEGRGNLPERRILPEKKQIMPEIMKLYGKWVSTNLK